MTYELFLMRVMHRTGVDDRPLAQQLVRSAVDGLRQCLPADADVPTQGLPEPVAAQLVDAADAADDEICELDAIYERVAEELAVEPGFGLEFTQVVFQVIGECLGPRGRQRLGADLPASWAPYFEPRRRIVDGPLPHLRAGHTLAEGSPGSRQPLSESQPGHRQSLAHTDEPHAGEDLATSHGKPGRRTLAEGRPGSTRPLSDA